jgi:hypothetical protein
VHHIVCESNPCKYVQRAPFFLSIETMSNGHMGGGVTFKNVAEKKCALRGGGSGYKKVLRLVQRKQKRHQASDIRRLWAFFLVRCCPFSLLFCHSADQTWHDLDNQTPPVRTVRPLLVRRGLPKCCTQRKASKSCPKREKRSSACVRRGQQAYARVSTTKTI